ncbi:TPA: hypothetical protein ACQVQ9_005452, partial [Serratia marcescens]
MFGKKPENATQDDVMNLIGSKKTAPKAETEKTQQQKIQDYNNQVITNKQGNTLADLVAKFPEQVKNGAKVLLEQAHKDSESSGNPAPKGFFKLISSKFGYNPEIHVITAYLFKHWHEQAGNMVQGDDIDPLLEACVELKKYIEAQEQSHILKEFAGYYLTALAVNYAMFLTKDFPAKRDMVLEKLLAVEKLCKKLMHIPIAEPRQQTAQPKAPAQDNPLDNIFVSSVKNFGTSIEQVMHDMKEHEAQRFYAQDKAVFLKLANYCYLILLNLKMAMNAGKEVEFDFDAHEALKILKTSPLFKEVEAADFSKAVLNVVFSVFLRWDTQDLTAQQRLGIMQMGGQLLKTVGNAVHELVIGKARATAAEGMKAPNTTDFVASLQAKGSSIEQIMQEIKHEDAPKFYAQDKATFIKLANYTYPVFLKLKQALQAGQEAEFDFDVPTALAIIKESQTVSIGDAPVFASSVVNVVFAAYHKFDTTDLDMGDRISLFKFGSQLKEVIENAVGGLLVSGYKEQYSQPTPTGLTWFDTCGIDDFAFLALKAAANNFYERDLAHNSHFFKEYREQLPDIADTDFGKAMFYTGFGLMFVAKEKGIEGVNAIAPILEAFNRIADWIATQPNPQPLLDFLNVPVNIIKSIDDDLKTPAFNIALDGMISYIKNTFALVSGDGSLGKNIAEAMAAMEKLQEGIEQIPGIDPADV